MNFTPRFLLGFALVFLCSSNGSSTLRPTRNTQFTLSNPSTRSRREDYKQNLEPLLNIRTKARRRSKDELVLEETRYENTPKTEITISDKYIKSNRIRIPNNVNKYAVNPTGADNVETSTKLKKAEPYNKHTEDVFKEASRSYQKEFDSYPRNRHTTYPRVDNTKFALVDVTRYVPSEAQSKNKIYRLPISNDADRYISSEDIFRQNTHSYFSLELTTPKTTHFDNRYTSVVRGVNEKLEDFDFYFGRSNNEFSNSKENNDDINLDDLLGQTKNNDSDTDLEFVRYKKLEANDSKNKNKIHKDYISEQATNLSFRSSYNETHVINEEPKDEQNNIPASDKETISEPEHKEIFEVNLTKYKSEKSTESNIQNENVDEDNIANPLGEKEIVNENTPRNDEKVLKSNYQITTRKNYPLTKTPIGRNASRISLLSNKIETDVIKPVEVLRSTRPVSFSSTPPNEPSNAETENKRNNPATRYVPIVISKRGSIKFLDTTTQTPKILKDKRKPDDKKANKTAEQAVQENQIVPIQILAPEDNTKEPTSLNVTRISTRNSNEELITVSPNTTPSSEKIITTPTTISDETSYTDENSKGTTNEESTEKERSTTALLTTTETASKMPTETFLTESIRASDHFYETVETSTIPPSSKESSTTQNPFISSEITTESVMTSVYTEKSDSDLSTWSTLPDFFTDSSDTENTSAFSDEEESLSTVDISDSTKYSSESDFEDSTKLPEKTRTYNRLNTQRELNLTTFTLPLTTTPKSNLFTENEDNSSDTVKPTTINEASITTAGDFEMTKETDHTVANTDRSTSVLKPKMIPNTEPSITIVQPTRPTQNISVPLTTQFTPEEETTDATSTEELEGTDGKDELNTGTIAAIAISSIGAICLVLVAGLLIIMRKRQKHFNYGQRCTPVSLDDYSMDHVGAYSSVRRKGAIRSSKRSYGNPAFDDPTSVSHVLNFPALAKFASNLEDIKEEFEEIPQVTAQTTELPEGCETKNRYANVIPLPETRVFLSPIDGYPNSDYINANYVTGPKNIRGYYIATQAPMQNTIDDFWRMIWEQQSKVILMLTHLFENGAEKCIDYLPPSEVLDCHRLFGDFQVTLKKREVKDKYIISSLQLKNMVSNSWREVTHFWYLGWPEKGVPSEENSIIAFLIEARSYVKIPTDKGKDISYSNGGSLSEVNPVVVHCSPGTGRTGTVIACDIAIREFELTRQVDIPRIVYRIRRDRASSVQTKEQYSFIYKVISLYATKLTGGALDSF